MYLLKFWITSLLLYPLFLLLFLSLSPLFTVPSELILHYVIHVISVTYLAIPAFFISIVLYKLFPIRLRSPWIFKTTLAAECIMVMIATFALLPDGSLLNPGDYIVQSSAAIAVALIISTLIFRTGLEGRINESQPNL